MKIPKDIKILGQTFKVSIKKIDSAGETLMLKSEINIQNSNIAKDEVLFHEILEIIMIKMGHRYEGYSDSSSIVFHFNHQEFNQMADIILDTLKDNKFIK